jgi:hypothetical protein
MLDGARPATVATPSSRTAGGPPDPGSSWSAASVASSSDPSVIMTIFFGTAGLVLLSCTRAVFGTSASLRGPAPAWLVQRKTRFMPDYIRLLQDAFGNPILPKHRVTSLVEHSHVWDCLSVPGQDGRHHLALVHGNSDEALLPPRRLGHPALPPPEPHVG